MSTSLEQLNAQVFREQLHTNFNVRSEAEAVQLKLAAVEEKDRQGIELFVLHFVGPFTPRLEQKTHKLEHEKLGEFEIFITPISAEPQQGTTYESIFHRFRKQPS
ncbi:MAG TPA: hypothetical protein VE133_19195 [Candidatus Sulfotelmatobacter sp.]|jgi:hypothetical protein|nr:hypothetical protein [Candidatus Sulfotelmatobacter sp.]